MSRRRRARGEAQQRGCSLLAAAMIGVGLMAAVDEVVFHQILAWHHVYDWSTVRVALLSDGVLHAAEPALIVPGFLVLANMQQRRALAPRSAWAGLFLGTGGFQLFDGLADHKVQRLHQIRYDIDSCLEHQRRLGHEPREGRRSPGGTMSEHIVQCPTCGARWPSTQDQPTCPVCAGVDPNEGGSPGPGEDDIRPPSA